MNKKTEIIEIVKPFSLKLGLTDFNIFKLLKFIFSIFAQIKI